MFNKKYFLSLGLSFLFFILATYITSKYVSISSLNDEQIKSYQAVSLFGASVFWLAYSIIPSAKEKKQ